MTCPKCKSENVNISAVNEFDLKDKHHGCIWWLCIGWWWVSFKWLFLTLPALIIKIFVPKKKKIVTKQRTICVCQNCGHKWEIGKK